MAELIHGPFVGPTTRRGQIAREAPIVCKDRQNAARRDLRNKLRLAYRVPYHEWEAALARGDGAVAAILEGYGAKHWPPAVGAAVAARAGDSDHHRG